MDERSGTRTVDAAFWEKARAHLVRDGDEFTPFVAARARELHVRRDGRRIRDFCSDS